MKEVESFQISFDDTNYQIAIYSTEFNRLTAYFAVAHDGHISQKIFYKDKNEMVYYFTDIKELRSRLELFVESLKSTKSNGIKPSI